MCTYQGFLAPTTVSSTQGAKSTRTGREMLDTALQVKRGDKAGWQRHAKPLTDQGPGFLCSYRNMPVFPTEQGCPPRLLAHNCRQRQDAECVPKHDGY